MKNEEIKETGKISDGYDTFDELYYHRMVLFSVICNQNKNQAWRSRLHDDGTMYDNYFIVGVLTPEGHYTYHYHNDYWDMFDVTEVERAPKYDGHKPEDVTRLLTLDQKDASHKATEDALMEKINILEAERDKWWSKAKDPDEAYITIEGHKKEMRMVLEDSLSRVNGILSNPILQYVSLRELRDRLKDKLDKLK